VVKPLGEYLGGVFLLGKELQQLLEKAARIISGGLKLLGSSQQGVDTFTKCN
jgi:hypothetical protein